MHGIHTRLYERKRKTTESHGQFRTCRTKSIYALMLLGDAESLTMLAQMSVVALVYGLFAGGEGGGGGDDVHSAEAQMHWSSPSTVVAL